MSFLKKISINTENKSFIYPILIGDNYIDLLENNFSKTLKEKKIYVIYDEFFNKLKSHKNLVENFETLSTKLSSEVFFFKIRSKDKFKNLEKLSILLNFLSSSDSIKIFK